MLILIIILIFLVIFWYYSEFNTQSFKLGNNSYNVHNNYEPMSSAECLAEIDNRIILLKQHLIKKYACTKCPENMKKHVHQLIRNYNSNNLYEISPNNLMGNTSFTEYKSKIVFCIRDKNTKKIHDINTIMFVALHEITHVMNDKWGHEIYFWELFRVILSEAAEIGIYIPEDYSKYPKKYCGINITQNPLF